MNYKGLDLGQLTDEEVLFFIRVRGKRSYFRMVYGESFLREFGSLRTFRTISEYRKDADVYIDLRSVDPLALTPAERKLVETHVDEIDVIRRCRGLRAIDYTEASALIRRAAAFFIRLFASGRLKLIVTGAVDNYVMDVMVRMAHAFDVRTLGITEFLLAPTHKLVTVRGEHTMFRQPAAEEVRSVYETLRRRAVGTLAIPRGRALRNAAYDFLSYVYRVIVRHVIGYRLLGLLSYEHRFAPVLRKFYTPLQILGVTHLRGEDALRGVDLEHAVYVPLHYTPEASVDYWVEDSRDADYLTSLVRVVRDLEAAGRIVVLKEHPYCFLARPLGFYETIERETRAIILNPFIPSKRVFELVPRVIVWTGSSGVEAAIMGRDVKIVTENYYSGGGFKRYLDETPSILSEEAQLKLVERVLQTSLPVS